MSKKKTMMEFIEKGSDFQQAEQKRENGNQTKPDKSAEAAVETNAHFQSKKITHIGHQATFYLRKDLIKSLRILAAESDLNQSLLVNEAIEDLLRKYGKK